MNKGLCYFCCIVSEQGGKGPCLMMKDDSWRIIEKAAVCGGWNRPQLFFWQWITADSSFFTILL